MTKKLLGNFPVFAEEAKLGDITDVNGNVLPLRSYPSFHTSNTLAYAKGFTELNPKVMNGALNFITSGLSYLYKQGVPEFTLNVAYPKGAVVTFNGNLYISLCDDNIKHISQSSYWGKFVFEHTRKDSVTSCNKDDGLPIGTILTVPVAVEKEGYIDYVEGHSFNPAMYPELYTVLGSKEFAVSNQSTNNELPLGSVVHLLSVTSKLPDGWIEWDTSYGSLRKYPELLAELTRMAQRLPLGVARDMWLNALDKQSLPMFENGSFHLALGDIGLYKTDSVKQQQLVSAPIVIDSSNTLNPMGYTRCAAENNTQPAVVNPDMDVIRTLPTSYVIVGHTADQYQDVAVNKNGYITYVGDADVTAPKTLFTRLIIKAVNQRPSSISSTHKQIIKAFTLGE